MDTLLLVCELFLPATRVLAASFYDEIPAWARCLGAHEIVQIRGISITVWPNGPNTRLDVCAFDHTLRLSHISNTSTAYRRLDLSPSYCAQTDTFFAQEVWLPVVEIIPVGLTHRVELPPRRDLQASLRFASAATLGA